MIIIGTIASSVISITPTVEYLVVAGGGGGGTSGANYCGGGGAGGLLASAGFAVSSGVPLTITIGAAGAANANGSNSIFSTLTTIGGGRGAYAYAQAGGNGGSGGGGGPVNGVGGLETVGQGFSGGVASSANQGGSDSAGGGGGGAGGIGSPGYRTGTGPFSNSPMGGGAGLSSTISGVETWYAAGGTGSGWYAGTNTNGIGGSTYGGSHAAGTINTGSGGGGGRSGAGGSGGSGIVIIRYADTYKAAASTTGATITVAGGYRVYTWATSGTITF